MTPQSGSKTITIHILFNISRSKGKETLKVDELIEHNKRNIFLLLSSENETGRLIPELFFFFKKALYEVKTSGLQRRLNIFRYSSTWHTVKTNCIKL